MGIQRTNQRTTIATPRMVAEDALLFETANELTIAAVELDAGRRSRRAVEVPAIGVRTKMRPRKWRVASTKTKRSHREQTVWRSQSMLRPKKLKSQRRTTP